MEFGERLKKMNDENYRLRERVKALEDENLKYVQMGRDFEQMMKATKNPITKDAWNKFMMTLRLVE